VWLVAVPAAAPRRGNEVRMLLALLVVLEALQTYPIAGTQAVPFACLMPAVGMITVRDAWRDLPERWRAPFSHAPWRWSACAAILALAVAFHPLRTIVPALAKRFSHTVPSELPGAEPVRMSERRVAEFQWTSANLRANGKTLLGVPGLHSFWIWSSLAPPVPFYPNTWILFYGEDDQEKLARSLMSSERPCVLRDPAMIEFWTGRRTLREGPVSRLLEREFRLAASVGEYELLLPRATQPDLVLSVLSEPAPDGLRDRFGLDRALRLSFPAMDGVRVARLVVRDTVRNADVLDSDAEADDRRLSIVDACGQRLLRPGSTDVIDLSRRAPIYLLAPTSGFALDSGTMLVRALDERGRIVARLLSPNGVRSP
jgi:hypothetical protein